MSMTDKAKEQIDALVRGAYERCADKGLLPAGAELKGTVEIPKDTVFGDYACSYAMSAARAMRMAPKAIAETLAGEIDLSGSYFGSVSVAGAGFINFTLAPNWYGGVLADVEEMGADYGSIDVGKGKSILVEFVSANPTGPMHMGNARGGVLGDSLASVLSRAGYAVSREFYVNDTGNQIDKFARSIDARYRQLIYGEDSVPFPEDGYHGDDIKELAKGFLEKYGPEAEKLPESERLKKMGDFGLEHNIPKMRSDLERYKIFYDKWYFESTLHESGFVAETLEKLTEMGCTYEKDGALWLKTGELLRAKYKAEGKSDKQIEKLELKDDVLRRANGFCTYFAADIAYHRDKLERRKFDTAINIWGADHHGHVARLQAALDALGLDGSHRLVIVLMQLVNLMRDGEVVRMSKRTGKAIALCDLLDEISVDAARYFFNSRASDSHLDFDLGLAVREDSENPVYYVQYAHARICSLAAALKADGFEVPKAAEIDPSVLNTAEERELIKQIALLPEEIRLAARDWDPSRINRYVQELAARFHRFYNACRIRGEEENILLARLKLAETVKEVIANCLGLIGVTAPEKM